MGRCGDEQLPDRQAVEPEHVRVALHAKLVQWSVGLQYGEVWLGLAKLWFGFWFGLAFGLVWFGLVWEGEGGYHLQNNRQQVILTD